jgi:undecaprenyl-diphosphatase
MSEWLYDVDRWIFHVINSTLSTPVGDTLWPLITDYDRLWPVRVVLVAAWLYLLIKGGVRGRTAALLLIPLLVFSDQLSSTVIKEFVGRARPCHSVNGVPVVPDVHLLVTCGGGKSFPSSHAVNNFGVAVLLSFYFRRWKWAFFTWAGLVALSRVAVGVHYPSDIAGGAIIGSLVGLGVAWGWTAITRKWFPRLTVPIGSEA